jgi:hypothetical protein
MPLLAVELNDAGLTVARGTADGVATAEPSPGYALLHDGCVLVGNEAARRSRIAPLYAQNRYWQQLSLERLPWTTAGVGTQADLAFAHLSSLIEPLRADAEGIVLAVPPGYSREQLGLLVGIASETGVPVRGLVDLALAACSAYVSAAHLLHLDLQLHEAVVTVLEHARADGALRRVRYEILPGAGLLAIQQALVENVATTFVRRTRFDPLHEAATEQSLVDQLPGWLAALEDRAEIELELATGGHAHRVEWTRQACIDAIEHPLAEVQRLVQASRPAGLAASLCVSRFAAAVPGLLSRLAALRDCVVTALPAGAAAVGALERAESIVRPPEGVALVHRLPVTHAAGPLVEAPAALAPMAPELTPTHVLHAGQAWPITGQPLVLGSAVTGQRRVLALPPGTPGLSKSHCTLRAQEGVALVEDHSTYGTFVNDERVTGRLALKVGDVLRLGAPGVSLELIRVLLGDGAP